jgi:peptidoglycan/xylan/chitin deacetylase (PgdA/CDA1 family)
MKGRELQKFTKYVTWCDDANVYCVPNVLCQDIEAFPEAIQMLNDFEQVDLHGWDHGPYGDRSYEEICEHLEQAMAWFYKNTNHTPIRWVTPHGANSRAIQDAAAKFNLIVEDTTLPVVDQKVMDKKLRETHDLTRCQIIQDLLVGVG